MAGARLNRGGNSPAEVLRGSCFYCGLPLSLVGGVEVAEAGGVCEVGTAESDFGRSGTVVIALSGFSRLSLLGPKPRLIRARESGTVLLCHP